MYNCPKCGTSFEKGTKFCSKCGCDLVKEFLIEPVCPKCGKEYPDGSKFCQTDASPLTTKDRMIPKCVKCDKTYPPDVKFCPDDGGQILAEALRSSDFGQTKVAFKTAMTEERKIEFTGTGFQALGWGLLAVLLMLVVIPAAWGAVALYRWLVRNLSFSDGTKASFEGRGGQVWGYFVIASLLAFVPQLSRAVEDPAASFLVLFGLTILLLPISAAIWLRIMRWFFSSIRLSCGTYLNFKGNYGSFLGWMLLVSLSFFTIIGWAWASVAMLRWVCRNIEAGQNQLKFVGSGWGLLWRCFLAGLASVLIIPIPWVWLWVVRWVTGNMLIKQETV